MFQRKRFSLLPKHKIVHNLQINEQINDMHQLPDHVHTEGSWGSSEKKSEPQITKILLSPTAADKWIITSHNTKIQIKK